MEDFDYFRCPRRRLIKRMMPLNTELGSSFATTTKTRFSRPGIATDFPRMVSMKPMWAAARAVIPELVFFSAMPARERNSVCVMPGQNKVTVTPVSANSFRNEAEKDCRNALQAAYTDWNGTG